MRPHAAAAAVTIALGLTGCGSDRDAPAPEASRPSSTAAAATRGGDSDGDPASTTAPPARAASSTSAPRPNAGHIVGKVETDCASDPRSGSGCYSQAAGVAGADVEVVAAGGRRVASVVTAADGSFEFFVPPGRYTIRETSSGAAQERDVAADRPTFVTLLVPRR